MHSDLPEKLQFFGDEFHQRIVQRFDGAMPHRIGRESLDLHPAGHILTQTTLTHIQNGFIVHTPDRRAMRTFHVIGVNLQLRQRIDTRRIAQQYIAALLHGISMLGIGCHVNQTVEPPRRRTTGNSLDMGFASAIGDIVRRMQPHGAMFIATDHKEAMKQSFGSCAVEFRTIGSLGTGELQCRNPARTARSLRQTDLGGRTTREDLQQIQLRPLAERNPQSRSAAILVQHN